MQTIRWFWIPRGRSARTCGHSAISSHIGTARWGSWSCWRASTTGAFGCRRPISLGGIFSPLCFIPYFPKDAWLSSLRSRWVWSENMNNHHMLPRKFRYTWFIVENETVSFDLALRQQDSCKLWWSEYSKDAVERADSSLPCRMIYSLLELLGVWTSWEELQITQVA